MRKRVLLKSGLYSIQGRLTAIALCFIAGTSMAVGIAGFRVMVNFENERFSNHFQLLATYLATNAELGVLLGNKKILDGLTQNMLTIPDVCVVEIFGKNDRRILLSARQTVPEDLSVVSVPVVTAPMAPDDSPFMEQGVAGEVVGLVRLSYSRAGLDQLKKLLAGRFVLISLALAMVPIAMYWMLAGAISAPLQGILFVAAQVSRGRMDIRAKGGGLQETKTLARAINEMLDALAVQREKLDRVHAEMAKQQVLAEVGKFSMIVAHEFKNPLAIIKGSLDVLKKDAPLDPAIKVRLLGFLDDEIVRLNKLIEDFLLFARPQGVVFQTVSVAALFGPLFERFKLMVMQGDTLLRIDLVDPLTDDWAIVCDPNLLERAFSNIVRNALDVSRASDEVIVTLRLDAENLVLTIEDGGPGVVPENVTRIFEPFFSTKAKGSGLGLAIAKEIVEAHGGTIAVTNRENGAGACFIVRLPVARVDGGESMREDGLLVNPVQPE